jgi:hypothetical protein
MNAMKLKFRSNKGSAVEIEIPIQLILIIVGLIVTQMGLTLTDFLVS